MNANLTNRPRCVRSNMGDIRRWFEGFKKQQKYIAEFPTKWLTDNKLAIMKRFGLHSVSGIKPEELLVFFIECEVLGEEAIK